MTNLQHKWKIDVAVAQRMKDLRLTAWGRIVAEALGRAEKIDETTADPYAFQVFREEMTPSVREYGWMDHEMCCRLLKLPTLAWVISSLAQWMVHGPAKRCTHQGINGTVVSLPRLPDMVDGETGYELRPKTRIVVEVLQYFPYTYFHMSGVDGSYPEQPTFAITLKCRWRLEDVP